MNVFGELASEIMEYEFANDTGIANYELISGWLESNLGQLNTLVYKDFSGFSPEIDEEAQAIFKNLYMHHYYQKQARNALRGIDSSNGSDILSIDDGNSSVRFVNKNEVSKVYRSLARDIKDDLDSLVTQYCMYEAKPQQVGGYESEIHTGGYC